MLGAANEAYDAVVVIDAGAHALEFLCGTHTAVVRLSHGLAGSHVVGLHACVYDGGDSPSYEFSLRRPIVELLGAPGELRGRVATPADGRVRLAARARGDAARSFELLASSPGEAMRTVGSLRLGQRVLLDGARLERRDLWSFLIPRAAA